ncbi:MULTISPECIES: hypothetical protein [Auritidibacter]|uniref:hypothetical protein n=1 Tax=Auritidibacter TaxID=1160973 RepID=UPI0015D57A34|nr:MULTISPECIES: hypothetical protein [Auritidibacter]
MGHENHGCPIDHHTLASSPGQQHGPSRSPHRRADEIDPHDLDMTAYWSSPKVQARNAIFQIDTDMQRHYAALKAELIEHLSPVIIVNNDPKGGEYTLVFDGKTETLHPIPETFELTKSVAHIPLGIFSIIAPYFKGSETTDWVPTLTAFADTLTVARRPIREANLPGEFEASCRHILDAGIGHIERSVEAGYVSIKSFERFSASVYDSIPTNMWYASDAQITGVQKIMKRWKKKIAHAQWKDVYVVVLSIWTTSVLNQNSIIIRELMDPTRVGTHLIYLPCAELPEDYVFVALDNIARIVQDNVAAEMVFPTDQEVADALKGTEDLLSDTILEQLGEGSSDDSRGRLPSDDWSELSAAV